KAAMLVAAGQAAARGLVSAKVAALTAGVLKAMVLTKLKVATAVCLAVGVLVAGAGWLSYHALAAQAVEEKKAGGPRPTDGAKEAKARVAAKDAQVQKVLDKYRSFRPDEKGLAIFQLDWVPTLKDAKAKAAKEKRPICLVVVTNSFGNMYTGHC